MRLLTYLHLLHSGSVLQPVPSTLIFNIRVDVVHVLVLESGVADRQINNYI